MFTCTADEPATARISTYHVSDNSFHTYGQTFRQRRVVSSCAFTFVCASGVRKGELPGLYPPLEFLNFLFLIPVLHYIM